MKKQKPYKIVALQIILFAFFGMYLINVFHHGLGRLAHSISHQVVTGHEMDHHFSDHHKAHAPHQGHEHQHEVKQVKDHNHSLLAIFDLSFKSETKIPFDKNASLTGYEFDKHLLLKLHTFNFPAIDHVSHFRNTFSLLFSYPDVLTPPPQA